MSSALDLLLFSNSDHLLVSKNYSLHFASFFYVIELILDLSLKATLFNFSMIFDKSLTHSILDFRCR